MIARSPRLNADQRALAVLKRALAAANDIEEVLKTRTLSAGLRAAASAAKNRTLEIEAAELHVRTTRKLGHMMAVQKKFRGAFERNGGYGPSKKRRDFKNPA